MPNPQSRKPASDGDRNPGDQQPNSRHEVRLIIPPSERDVQGLRALASEWLLPRLAQEFLSEHAANRQKTDIQSLGQGAASGRKDK